MVQHLSYGLLSHKKGHRASAINLKVDIKDENELLRVEPSESTSSNF